ncbi:hypothetical protein AZI86_06205 [Bdellovibrio bacteriovorus]|uniref:Glycosyltransferase RgtA/B/C/D-like domain-containing protein n=1 Tax=Bdellovibrio bacteriovorus TaxID=959 RepID=A0A150WR06_BDEBC|nr:glycosyltransferase family 39 protein [Bdellovibrio bacteriovorus]KYG66635.1 hypothetical protein AZI86_06205 [Bdellovibrio bacteriovorus]
MKNSFWRIFYISLAVKLVLAALMPLGADEAYYWVWSHRLQLSYFDHPPMVAWILYLGHFLEPFMHAVRWPAVIMGHMVILMWYYFLKDRLPWEKIRLWLYLALFSPLLGFGSLIVTPDLPVVVFWTLSLILTVKALETRETKYYAFLGIALGLGFCAKYHIVIFIPCLLAYLSFEKRWSNVNWKGVIYTGILGLIFCAPVLLWNYQNDFASFEFQLRHGLESEAYELDWTTSYIFAQILIMFPLIFWAIIKAKPTNDFRWSIYFTWGPLLFFLLTSFRALVEANWPVIAYPSLLTLALFHPKTLKWSKSYMIFWGTAISVVVLSIWVPQFRNINEKVSEPYEFQSFVPLVQEYQPLYGASYQISSSLWYFSKIPVFKLKDTSRFDFFDTLPESIPTGSKFYLLKKEWTGAPYWVTEQGWQAREVKKLDYKYVIVEFTKP